MSTKLAEIFNFHYDKSVPPEHIPAEKISTAIFVLAFAIQEAGQSISFSIDELTTAIKEKELWLRQEEL